MPGAAGLIQGTYVANKAKKDGLTWAIMGTSHLGSQALNDPKPNYDLAKMPVIFGTSGSSAAIVRDFLNVKKGTDLVKVEPSKIAVSGRSITGPSFLNDAIGLDLLGIKGYRYAVGYPGTAQMALAFLSGEVSYVGGTGLHHVLGSGGRIWNVEGQQPTRCARGSAKGSRNACPHAGSNGLSMADSSNWIRME